MVTQCLPSLQFTEAPSPTLVCPGTPLVLEGCPQLARLQHHRVARGCPVLHVGSPVCNGDKTPPKLGGSCQGSGLQQQWRAACDCTHTTRTSVVVDGTFPVHPDNGTPAANGKQDEAAAAVVCTDDPQHQTAQGCGKQPPWCSKLVIEPPPVAEAHLYKGLVQPLHSEEQLQLSRVVPPMQLPPPAFHILVTRA